MRRWASSRPRPQSSTPQLLLTTSRSVTPASSRAAIRALGMPQRPNPPTASRAPSGMSATACGSAGDGLVHAILLREPCGQWASGSGCARHDIGRPVAIRGRPRLRGTRPAQPVQMSWAAVVLGSLPPTPDPVLVALTRISLHPVVGLAEGQVEAGALVGVGAQDRSGDGRLQGAGRLELVRGVPDGRPGRHLLPGVDRTDHEAGGGQVLGGPRPLSLDPGRVVHVDDDLGRGLGELLPVRALRWAAAATAARRRVPPRSRPPSAGRPRSWRRRRWAARAA